VRLYTTDHRLLKIVEFVMHYMSPTELRLNSLRDSVEVSGIKIGAALSPESGPGFTVRIWDNAISRIQRDTLR
jgi:hypothetical protein